LLLFCCRCCLRCCRCRLLRSCHDNVVVTVCNTSPDRYRSMSCKFVYYPELLTGVNSRMH
jgi:hypothetical protein